MLLLFIGGTMIRTVNCTQIIFWLQYILPIDTKPMRSIGIFVTLLCLLVFGSWSLVSWVIELASGSAVAS